MVRPGYPRKTAAISGTERERPLNVWEYTTAPSQRTKNSAIRGNRIGISDEFWSSRLPAESAIAARDGLSPLGPRQVEITVPPVRAAGNDCDPAGESSEYERRIRFLRQRR